MSAPTPYWTSPDGTITVYCARWEDVHAAGLVPARDVALIHADGPYGVDERTERAANGRSHATAAIDFPAVRDDDRPFDPAPLLAFDRPLVMWGANHFSDRVPGSPSWITWDKKCDTTPDDNADCEHAWTNLGGPARIFRHLWRGMIKASERTSKRVHPTQKPIALSTYIFGRAKLKRGDLVFVPYLGSGPDLPAAVAMGLKVIAVEGSRTRRTAVQPMNEPASGRYETSRGVPFTLVQVDGGYRREFDPGRWTWDEARMVERKRLARWGNRRASDTGRGGPIS